MEKVVVLKEAHPGSSELPYALIGCGCGAESSQVSTREPSPWAGHRQLEWARGRNQAPLQSHPCCASGTAVGS